MIRVRNTLAVIAFTALFGCAVDSPASTPTTDQVNLTLHSTYATQPLTRELSQHYADIRPEFNLEIQENSYSQLMAQLKQETIDYFISSYVPVDDEIWAAPIARDGLALIVHPDNPLDTLELDTIRDIFSGKQKTWAAEDAIKILTYPTRDDVYHEFHHLVMGRQRITSNARAVPNIAAMLEAIVDSPDTIGYIPLSHVTDAVKVVAVNGILPDQTNVEENVYPLRTTLFVIGREEPPPVYRTFISWVQSSDGQSTVARDYIPLP